jgi:hypothetical protein
MLNRDGELALVHIKDRFERVQLCWLRSENVILSHNSFRPACVKAIISKDEFIRRLTKMGLADEPGIFEEIDRDWDLAMQVAGILKSEMPGIGVLSERKSIRCFLSVCSHVDRLIESKQLTFETATLALLILRVTSSNFSKAQGGFMYRAPNISWQEALSLPKTALEFFKAARGQ